MRVLVTNAFPDDNRGGAAITIQTVRMVREAFADANVTIMAVRDEPDLTRPFRHTLVAFPDIDLVGPPIRVGTCRGAGLLAVAAALAALLWPRFYRRSFAAIADADLVVSKGGHYFVDRPSWRGSLGLALMLLPLLYAIRVGRPVMLSGAHVGQAQRRSTRLLLALVFRRAAVVAVRDEESAAAARRLGTPAQRVHVVPDTAFAMSAPDQRAKADAVDRAGLQGQRYGVLCARSKDVGTYVHARRMNKLVGALLDAELVDTLVGVVQVNQPEDDDIVVMRAIASRSGGRIKVISDDWSPDELIALYEGAEWVVTSRLHAAIFSVIAETPAVCVDIGDKGRRIFEALGLGDWVFDASTLDSEIVSLVTHISSDTEGSRVIGHAKRNRAILLDEMVRLLHAAAQTGRCCG